MTRPVPGAFRNSIPWGVHMARRAQCRCGFQLKARRGPDGYKTRCPNCRANVRVRRSKKRRDAQLRPVTTCVCGAVVVLDRHAQACPCCGHALAASLPVPEFAGSVRRDENRPPRILDLFEESHESSRSISPLRVRQALVCSCCGEHVPADAGCCLWCGSPRPELADPPPDATAGAPPLQCSLFRRMLGKLLRK